MNILDKEFYYQDTASVIVDSILSLISQGVKNFESYESWIYTAPLSYEEEYSHFNWRYNVCRIDDKNWVTESGYDLYGLAGKDFCDEPSIEISVAIPKGKHQKRINFDRSELFDVVAHELHHLAQNIEGNCYPRPDNNHSGRLSYLLDPYEVEAFHIGIRARSALTGRSFESIAYDYISKSWPEGDKNQIEEVIKEWKNTDFPAFRNNIVRGEA